MDIGIFSVCVCVCVCVCVLPYGGCFVWDLEVRIVAVCRGHSEALWAMLK